MDSLTAPPLPATRRSLDLRKAQRAAIALKQAGDPTRLRILLLLADGEIHVGALCEAMGMTQPAVSHHLALLRHGGIIYPRRAGKQNFYTLAEAGRQLVGCVGYLVA